MVGLHPQAMSTLVWVATALVVPKWTSGKPTPSARPSLRIPVIPQRKPCAAAMLVEALTLPAAMEGHAIPMDVTSTLTVKETQPFTVQV